MDEKKLALLYGYLKQNGAQVGDEKQFNTAMQDEKNLRGVWRIMKDAGDDVKDEDAFISEYKSPKQPQTVVGDFMQSAQDLATNTLDKKAQSDRFNEEASVGIKEAQDREKLKEGIVGGLINNTYREVQKKPIANMQGYEQVGLNVPKKIEKAPEVNWGETQYLESTKTDLPNEIATNQLDVANKAITHTISEQYGEDVWSGNTPTAKRINAMKFPLQEKAAKGELSDAQISLLSQVGKGSPKSQLLVDIATNGSEEEIKQFALNSDDEYAKKVYNEEDKQGLAKLRGVDVRSITPQDRMNYWYEKTKGLSKMDIPETIPYQLIANDSKDLQDQLGRISNLFQKETGEKPETTEQVVAAIPKSFDIDFANPQEKLYAYYQVLGNRFQELTRELQQSAPDRSQQAAVNVKERQEQLKALAGTVLPFIGVEDLKDPKYVEYMRVLNKIHALAPLIQKGQVGKAEGEWGDNQNFGGDPTINAALTVGNAVGQFAASMWSGTADMLGYDVLKTNQENIAREQQNALAQTGGNITPQQQKILDERMSTEGFFNPKSWGAQGSSLVGMGIIMASNPFAGEFQAGAKGLQMLSTSSKLFNSEQKLTRLGKVVQGAVGLTAAGLETEIAGQISGEGESVTDELSFGMGVAGEAGKLALGAVIGLVGKGATKITPKALVAQVEKQYGKLSPAAQKAVENYGTNISNRAGNAFGKELPEEVFQTGYENYKKHGLDGMMSATIRDIMGEDRDWNTAMRWVAQIALMGALDGQPDTDNYKLQTWAVTMAEKFSGQKVNVDLVNEFVDKMRKETENAPTGVKFKDNGVDFTLNNTQFSYTDGKIQAVGGKSVDAELQNKAAEVGAKMTDGYQAAVQNGDFNPLFGIDVANKTKEELDAARAEQGGQSVRFDNTDENANLQSNETQQNPAVSEQEKALETQTNEIVAPTAEELDVRRAEIATRQGEIEPQLRAAKIEAEDLKKQLKADYSDEIADKLDEKRLEIDVLEKEGLDLADEDTNIASQREITLTEKETIDKRKAEIKVKTEENSANIQQLQAQYESAVDEGNRDLMKSLSAEKADLVAENESLAKEIEALQPKEESVKNAQSNEKTDIQKSLSEDPTLQRGVLINHESEKTKEELMEIVEKLRNGSLSRQEVINLFPNLAVNTLGEVKQFFDDNTLADKIQFGLDVKAKEQVSKRSKAQIEKSKQAVLNNKKQSEKALAESEYKTVVKKDGLTGEKTETKVRRTAEEREKYENYHKGIINEADKSIKEYDSELAKLEKEAAEEISATEKTGSKENRIVETPIVETPKTENEVVEKVENLQNMTTSEESVTENKRSENPFSDSNLGKTAKRIEGITESMKGFSLLSRLKEWLKAKPNAKITLQEGGGKFMSDGGKGAKANYVSVIFKDKDGAQDRYITFKTQNDESSEKLAKELFTILEEYQEFQKNELVFTEVEKPIDKQQAEKEAETPVAPAAPKEEDNKPEKGKSKKEQLRERQTKKLGKDLIPPNPQTPKQETRTINKKEDFADFLYEMSKQTPEDRMMADYSAEVYNETAKAWAKREGKTVQDWWNRIESITIGGEKTGAQGNLEKTADGRFKLFLLANRDVSTPLHELSHIFQNDLSNAEKAKVVQWINKQFGEKFTPSQLVWEGGTDKILTPEARKISEFFARGWEQYLKEGKQLKDKAMQTIFDKFSEWLKGVYETAIQYMGKDIVLNDDMRKIYAEMAGQDQVFAQKIEKQKPSLVDEEATDPEQLVWNYFAKEGQINKQDVIDRFAAKNRGVVPAEKMKHINNSAYISETAKTKQQIAKDLFDSQTGEKEYDDIDYFKAVDAVVDEMGAGFSKVVTAKIKEYAANKNKTDDEEAINAQAEDVIEQVRKNRANKPNADEMLRMQYEKEIDEAIFGGNSLNQTANNIKAIENELISTAVIDRTADEETIEAQREIFEEDLNEYNENLPLESRFTAEEMRGIVDRAIEKVTNPPIEIKAEATAELEIDNQVREVVAKLNEDFTEENADRAAEKIDEILDNSLLNESQKEKIRDRNKIRERQFGAKFRDNYSIALGDAVRENILAKTYFYDKLKNDIALAQSKAQMELFLNDAIEQVADDWYNEGKLTDKNQKKVADSEAFYSAVLEKLIDITLNDLAKVSDIDTYWQKTGTTMYAVKLASEVSKQLNEKNTAESKAQARSLADKVATAIDSLAKVGTGGGRLINMFNLFANMNGALAKDYMATMMEGIYGEVTAKKKAIKDVVDTFLAATEDIVQDMASGKDSDLLDRIMEAVAKNPKVETLIDSILNRANTLEDLQEQIDISEEAEIVAIALKDTTRELNETNRKLIEAKKELVNRNNSLKNAKKRVDDLNNRVRILEAQIAKNGANIEALKKQLDKAKNELSSAETQLNAAENENKKVTRTNDALRKQVDGLNETIKNLKEERSKSSNRKKGTPSTDAEKIEKAAKQKAKRAKGQTDVTNALSKLLNYKGDNSLYQRTKINSQGLAGIYPAEVIRDVNAAIKAMADFFYEDTKTHTNSAQFYDDFIVYAKAQLAAINAVTPLNTTLYSDIVTHLDNKDFATTVEPYIQERINKDYKNNVRKRVIGINSSISDPAKKRKEIRQVLGDLVMKAATATEEEKVNIEDLIKDVFGITDAQNIADFTNKFDREFNDLIIDKQKQLIAKKLLTDAERKGKTDAEIGKALLDKLEKQGHHKFLDNFAKDVRITAPNWSREVGKRLSETYEVAITSQGQLRAIDRRLKIADKMPDGILKEKAMHNVMVQFVRMVNFSNARKWRATANEMKHFNRLSGSTHLQNIGDTINKLISLFWGTIIPERLALGIIGQRGIFGNTKLGKNAKDTYIRQATGFATMFSDARRVAWNRFNLAEARQQHEFENVIDFYEKNFAELDPDLRNISWNRPIRALLQRLYLGNIKLWGGKSLAVGNKSIMEAFDVWGQYILNIQEQASMMNRMNVPTSEIFDVLKIDRYDDLQVANILKTEVAAGLYAKGDAAYNQRKSELQKESIPEIQTVIDNEISQGLYEKDSKLEFVRRQELLANYLQDKYGTSDLGKRYGLGMTYKLVPAGDLAGFFYTIIQATVNKLRQFENFALNHYEAKGGTALGAIYHTTSIITKVVNAFDYSKTMLNVANWLIDWDLTVATLRLAKNNAVSDVLFGADANTWEKHHNAVYDSKTKKERVSSTEFQNIAAQVHVIDKGIEEIDRQIAQYTNDADAKRLKENERAAAKIASINKRNIDPAEKTRLIAAVNKEKTATLANIDNVESRAKKPLEDTKTQQSKERAATVAAYESALSRKRGQLARNVIIYLIGFTSVILNASGDDDEDEPFIDIIGSSPEGKMQLAKKLNIEETAAKNRFIVRYGKLWSKPDVFSYGFTDTPFLIPFSIFGGINDQIRRVKYGKDGGEMAWTNSITQSALDISHQILSFRGLEMLSDAANPKTDNMTALMKLWQALSPYSVPAVIKQPLSDIQGAKTYKADKNAEGYVAAEFMRTFGLDRTFINTVIGTDVFAQQYSPLDGRPIRSWTNKDKLELGRFIFDAFHEGQEKSIKSLNQTRYQKDDFVQYLVYKGWLHKTGIAEKVGLTTIDNSIPVMENGKVIGMIAIPEADFQNFIVKPAGEDFEKAMIRMYQAKKYVLGFAPAPKGKLISSTITSLASAKTPKQLIEKAKKGDFDKPDQDVLVSAMAAKSDLTAFNLAVQEVAANLMEAQKAKYTEEYLKLHPEYKQLKEKFPAYKKRIEK